VKRETTNKIRYVLEELIPPVMRDSAPMRALFRTYWGPRIDQLEDLRVRSHRIGPKEYRNIYADYPRIQSETDNSEACLNRIAKDLYPGQVLDVGCGTGYLLRYLKEHAPSAELNALTGTDLLIDDETRAVNPEISFVEGKVERLPFKDDMFDTVVCTHLLEHILDIRAAIAELRRVCKKRLIIVVPREREHAFTFNPHLHFFPYKHSFLRQMIPVPESVVCEDIGRDIYYMEDCSVSSPDSSAVSD